MSSRHVLLLAGCLVGIGAMTSALHDWHEALTPAFVGGALGVVGTQIAAIFTDRP